MDPMARSCILVAVLLFGATAHGVDIQTCGAVCDGSTVDTDAIQDCLDANITVEVPPKTCLTGALAITNDNTFISGAGPASVLRFADGATNAALITGGTHPMGMANLRLYGGNTASCKTGCPTSNGRDGVSMASQFKGRMAGVWIDGFDGKALYLNDAAHDRLQHLSVEGVSISNSGSGIYSSDNHSEYVRIIGVEVLGTGTGIRLASGNMQVDSSRLTDVGVGIHIYGTGIGNNAHGLVTNTVITHAATWSILTEDVTAGEVFSGNTVIDGPIWLKNSTGILISDSILDVQSYCLDGGGRNVISQNHVKTGYTNTITHNCNAHTDNTFVTDNSLPDGTPLGGLTTITYEKLLHSQSQFTVGGTPMPAVATTLSQWTTPAKEKTTISRVSGRVNALLATGTAKWGFVDFSGDICQCTVTCTLNGAFNASCVGGGGGGCTMPPSSTVAMNWGQGGDVCETAQPSVWNIDVYGTTQRTLP